MKFVLPILIDLLISHHFLTLASSAFIKCSSAFRSLAEARHWYHLQRFWSTIFLSNLANHLCILKTKGVLMCSLVECHIALSAWGILPHPTQHIVSCLRDSYETSLKESIACIDIACIHLIQKRLLWALVFGHWEAIDWAYENNEMLCLSDRQTIASQCPITNAQSKICWIRCIHFPQVSLILSLI